MQIKRQKYSYELLQECSNYLNTHSLKETAIHYNLSYKTMINGLIRFGFYTPTRKHKITKNNCYNQNFFSKIDSHDKAYFLGFLMADGYICTTPYNKQIGIGIQTKDKYILEYYKNLIGKKLNTKQYKNSSKLTITSTIMYSDLTKLGFIENKSHNDYHFPDIPDEFKSSFICGYFDGDGCITIKSTGFSVCSICCNSKIFLEDLKSILAKYNILCRPICKEIKNRKNSIYVLYLSGRSNQLKFKDFIYKSVNVYLVRKYDKFMKIPC